MAELFPGFYERTDKEFSALWEEATLVLDTNMLLNVYRYQEETRERLFEILEKLKERLWIPHRVMYEYQKNRLEVIAEQFKVYSDVSKVIREVQARLKGLTYLTGKHRFIEIDAIIGNPLKALAEANEKLSTGQQRGKREFGRLKTDDSYSERITQLYQGKIGEPYKRAQLFEIYRQADKRYELQIPPGWKDKGKPTQDKYGDVILWFQLLDYAQVHNKPILFITDDVKSDWFLSAEESLRKPRPRPELIQEMYEEAGVLLYVYQGYEFFEQATKFLSLQPEESISEDAKEISDQNSAGDLLTIIGEGIVASYNVYKVLSALTERLPKAYPDSELIYGYRVQPDDWELSLVLVESDGTKTAIEVLPFSNREGFHELLMSRIEEMSEITEPMKFRMIIATDSIPRAAEIYSVLKGKVEVDERFSIIVAYVDSYGKYQEYALIL